MDILLLASGLLLRARRRSLGSPGELDKVSMVLLLVPAQDQEVAHGVERFPCRRIWFA